ncbi:ADE2 [Symbiodinium natans]|uniref:ADE2 protein n=1 Tax=Symbiodinium natans TaxID=878477 RepID=A0A812LNW7_9DINO|nr:ADE2 [Symbiodinium natans]
MSVADAGYPKDLLSETRKYQRPGGRLKDSIKSQPGFDDSVDMLGETKVVDRKAFPATDRDDPPAAPQPFQGDTHTDEPTQFGPDGMPLKEGTTVEEDEEGRLKPVEEAHQKVELHDQGWFHAESNRYEQEELAKAPVRLIYFEEDS